MHAIANAARTGSSKHTANFFCLHRFMKCRAFFLKGEGPDINAHCAKGPYAMAIYNSRLITSLPLPGAPAKGGHRWTPCSLEPNTLWPIASTGTSSTQQVHQPSFHKTTGHLTSKNTCEAERN